MENILWQASKEQISNSNLQRYISYLKENGHPDFASYDDLWQWSIDDIDRFWLSIWEYFEVIDHGRFTKVRKGSMPKTVWFEGSNLNYAEHIFRLKNPNDKAISSYNERGKITELTWGELTKKVAAMQEWLTGKGVSQGDSVCAYLPNTEAAIIASLACTSLGIIWSSCSQDFGSESLLERFIQINPKVIILATSYEYNGKYFDRISEIESILSRLSPEISIIEYKYIESNLRIKGSQDYEDITSDLTSLTPRFVSLPFFHPMYILFSSGTTGKPKAIAHCHGGLLLEHLKYIHLHNEVKPREKFFWYSTTGWMMWNFTVAALLADAHVVLYDGSPSYPNLSKLWAWADEIKINHFGTSAPFITACMKAQFNPKKEGIQLKNLKTIGSTGAPLPEDSFQYVYNNISKDVWLCSMSGGTDVCTAFVGSNILSPIVKGYIQGRALGVDMVAMDENRNVLIDQVGDMVIRQPLPSMPIGFWNDPDFTRYKESYFEEYGNLWRHGDWIVITTDGQLKITGRSDATLNRHGVRIGTAEIYSILDEITEVVEGLIINIELEDGSNYMPLFIKPLSGVEIDENLKSKINQALRTKGSPRHVPDEIIPVEDIPYTINGKKMEAPIKKLFVGTPKEKAVSLEVMKNPKCMDQYIALSTTYLSQKKSN
jgi:acetoacetyl-CoA synthetase